MAKAITHIRRLEVSEEEQRRQELKEIETLLIEHKEALKAFLHVLDKVNESGGLDFAAGLFDQGDKVLEVLVKAADNPGATKTLRNGLLLIGTLGQLNVDKLGPVIKRLNSGLEQAAQWSESDRSIGQLVGKANWKETLLFLLAFLKGIGETAEKQRPRGRAGWLAVAGLSLAGLMLLKKKSL